MLRRFGKCSLFTLSKHTSFVLPGSCGQQIRTTFILKRRWPPGLHKKDEEPRLRARNYIYDLVEDTLRRKHKKVNVLLTTYVEGYGNRGDMVETKPYFAYSHLLLPGLAVYPTTENIEKYTSDSQHEQAEKHSSKHAEGTAKYLSRLILAIVMNKEIPWTIEPWHIRMSFRKAGMIVPEEAITMPQLPIKGPDLSLELKEFVVKVTINGLENALVRCRIHHWSTSLADRLPYVRLPWRVPSEPVFPEEAEVINSLPPIAPPKKSASEL